MGVKEQLSALLSDYRLQHGRDPRRITVSAEVARKLEAVIDAQTSHQQVAEFKPVRLREGRPLFFQDIPVVSDLDYTYVLDVRKLGGRAR